MNISMKKKTTKPKATDSAIPHEEVFASSLAANTFVFKEKISKLEPFGNEDMHRLVAKINEIIDHV